MPQAESLFEPRGEHGIQKLVGKKLHIKFWIRVLSAPLVVVRGLEPDGKGYTTGVHGLFVYPSMYCDGSVLSLPVYY